MKLSKESHAISHSLNSYMKEHANEPMGHEKKEMKSKAKALKKASGKKEFESYMSKRREARKTGGHVMYKSY